MVDIRDVGDVVCCVEPGNEAARGLAMMKLAKGSIRSPSSFPSIKIASSLSSSELESSSFGRWANDKTAFRLGFVEDNDGTLESGTFGKDGALGDVGMDMTLNDYGRRRRDEL